MGKLIKTLLLLSVFIFSNSIYSAKGTYDKRNKSLNSHIRKNKKSIAQISKKIESLESNLGNSNKKYLSVLQRKNKIESTIYKVKEMIFKNTKTINNQLKESKALIRATLANSLGGDQSAQDLYSQKVLVNAAQSKIKNLNRKLIQVNKMKKEMMGLEARYEEYRSVEVSLLSLMTEMESEKKNYAQEYLNLKKKETTLLKQASQIKVSRVRTKKGRALRDKLGTFDTPLRNFKKFEYRKKGVTFHFEGKDFLRIGRNGRVAHTGRLSTYGNVVVVDHGQETRSVFLGEFNPRVKKNQMLQAGEIIGETKVNSEKVGKVYFEIRKKNKAQNTIHLLDQKELERIAKI